MDFKYKCPKCGVVSMIPFAEMSKGITCPACGHGAKTKKVATAATTVTKNASVTEDVPYLESLNPEQKLAAMYDGKAGGVLVLAGAGCGKTRTMVARALFLLKHKNVLPERIAMVTFTRRAAREIQERLEREIPGRGKDVFVGTFHRFCLNLMHKYPMYFPFQNPKILDADDQNQLLSRIRADMKLEGETLKSLEGILPGAKHIMSILSFIRNKRITIDDYWEKNPPDHAETIFLMNNVLKKYEEYKQTNEYLDFDDILTVVADNLKNNPSFRALVQKTLDHILVDEMQDTSPVQWDIIRSLYPPINLFCVGDDAQSIYGFRGADFESIHHFCDILPNVVSLKLTENYRSTQEILDVANALLKGSHYKYDRELRATGGKSGVVPSYIEFMDDDDEASSIVASIKQHISRGTPAKEIMVLLRSTYNARLLEFYLNKDRVPYRMIGGVGFMQAAHVKDVVATFEALVTMRNEMAWLRFLTLLPGIGYTTSNHMIAPIMSYNDRKSGLEYIAGMLEHRAEAIKERDSSAKKKHDYAILRQVSEFIRFMAGAHDGEEQLNPGACMKSILDFYMHSPILSDKYDKWTERVHDLESLQKIANNFNDVSTFLESFKLDPNAEAPEVADNKITLITVHSAKGTEADVCYVMRVQPGNYPHVRSIELEEIEEERRILYVAMTRARKELIMTHDKFINGCNTSYSSSDGFMNEEVRKNTSFN